MGGQEAEHVIDLRDVRNEPLVERLASGLYHECFPREMGEAEDASLWQHRLYDDANSDGPRMRIAVVVDGEAASPALPDIVGFVCSELYPRSRCGLISYLGVDPGRRQKGAGRRLIEYALGALQRDASSASYQLAAIFAEVHDPAKVKNARDVMDPRARFSFFAKMGARRVPLDYVQPPVDDHSPRVHTLALVTLPIAGEDSSTLDPAVVEDFLTEYYAGQDGPANDAGLATMLASLPDTALRLPHLNQEEEDPKLHFARYGIALHFVSVDEPRLTTTPPADEPFRSYERDVFAYAYRHSMPFSTTLLNVPLELRTVELRFAPETRYSAEGQAMTLVQTRTPPVHRVDIHACQTTFKSGISVKHLVLSPAGGGSDGLLDGLDEYEVIKLVKLWEDGEEVRGSFGGNGPQSCVLFTGADGVPLTVNRLAARVFDLEPDHAVLARGPSAGTVELLGGGLEAEVWAAAHNVAHYAEANPENWVAIRRSVEGLAGIVQGLIDFEEIGADELTDVFAGVDVVDSTLEGLHKGTLITVEHEDRPEQKGRPAYPVSPYLFLPQSVLLHNEALIERANDAWKSTENADRAPTLQKASETIQAALDADFLPNVFHYQSEQNLYTKGHASRGIDERARQFRGRLADVNAKYDFMIGRRRSRADDARNFLLLFLSFTSLRALWPKAPALVLLVTLAVIGIVYTAFIWIFGESKRLLSRPQSRRASIDRAPD